MSDQRSLEPMEEMFLVETGQLVDKLEKIIMRSESNNDLSTDIDEIFRIMHTVKGNSMMMMFDEVANLAHSLEDLFDFLKVKPKVISDYTIICDLVLETVDFFKMELAKISEMKEVDGSCSTLIGSIKDYLESLKSMSNNQNYESKVEEEVERFFVAPVRNVSRVDSKAKMGLSYYMTTIHFEEGCELENVRAFSIIHGLKDLVEEQIYYPHDIVENEACAQQIKASGFVIFYSTLESFETLQQHFGTTAFVKSIQTHPVSEDAFEANKECKISEEKHLEEVSNLGVENTSINGKQQTGIEAKEKQISKSFITVSLNKVNQLMDLVGELVVSESMFTRNPEVIDLHLESFEKAARQHRFIIKEVQDVVMSMRMVPLELTFQKMNRVVRDMTKKTSKLVNLSINGAQTEVDKNVSEHIADPLMHIIRNAIDHGIELPEHRTQANKPSEGTVYLDAKQSGGSVYITVKDDGKGIDREAVLSKAQAVGLLTRAKEDYSDKEVYPLLFTPGFSTNDQVTEFSGRGVGMDVVSRNIEEVGGTIQIDSTLGQGTEITIKIPLTLAIIEGMMIASGDVIFSLPINSISESMRVTQHQLIKDNSNREMIMIRGECVPVVRLYEKFEIEGAQKDIEKGILVMIENDTTKQLLFVDQIIGEQQLVVKRIPRYMKSIEGVSGCALLGDGRITLILDPTSLM
ncbi:MULTISPECIES: chemotaxis protein CheA [unclassified Fusibacter]|uniref:chemotaxis protein CheA n=1 Tax=unclassified Fusibacter TaxID=2624464 RepID=UPI001011FC6B|nr:MULTISPECIES: chemotaxis protein CheA [unclassified Fusibacter]MCK8061388.1 chemotaxis protein CheA [Fusibacter sp. A2]NPE23569.1 chemotaxis protein CheA [Fusibacter sp. A1]RXV58979.1 chemotaxis protein CheA [Fusibacter sp. A1]